MHFRNDNGVAEKRCISTCERRDSRGQNGCLVCPFFLSTERIGFHHLARGRFAASTIAFGRSASDALSWRRLVVRADRGALIFRDRDASTMGRAIWALVSQGHPQAYCPSPHTVVAQTPKDCACPCQPVVRRNCSQLTLFGCSCRLHNRSRSLR